jgi:hypothetical protein
MHAELRWVLSTPPHLLPPSRQSYGKSSDQHPLRRKMNPDRQTASVSRSNILSRSTPSANTGTLTTVRRTPTRPRAGAAHGGVHVSWSCAAVPRRLWSIVQHFRPRRHGLSAPAYRQEMRHRFETCQDSRTSPPPLKVYDWRQSYPFLSHDHMNGQ